MAQQGDLVTCTAKELNHPRLRFGNIAAGYFFGVVVSGDNEMVCMDWNDVQHNLKVAKVVKINERARAKYDVFREIKFVYRTLVRVVAKYDDPFMGRINHFVKSTIFLDFYYVVVLLVVVV